MDKADKNILFGAIKLVEDKVHRDFIEVSNLQNYNLSLNFTNKTIEHLQKTFFNYFIKKRPEYSLYIKNYKNNVVENSKYKIIINPISGIKNFLHAVPYFATVISILKDDKVVMGLVHNYTTNETFFVGSGDGVFLNNQRLRVSNRIGLSNLLIAVKYDLKKQKFKDLIDKLPMFKINNCSILDCCNTACGRYDASILLDADINDMLLGQLFIEEAGGLYRKINDNSYLFTNGVCMDEVLKVLE